MSFLSVLHVALWAFISLQLPVSVHTHNTESQSGELKQVVTLVLCGGFLFATYQTVMFTCRLVGSVYTFIVQCVNPKSTKQKQRTYDLSHREENWRFQQDSGSSSVDYAYSRPTREDKRLSQQDLVSVAKSGVCSQWPSQPNWFDLLSFAKIGVSDQWQPEEDWGSSSVDNAYSRSGAVGFNSSITRPTERQVTLTQRKQHYSNASTQVTSSYTQGAMRYQQDLDSRADRQNNFLVQESSIRALEENRNSCFPYRPSLTNTWFQELIGRPNSDRRHTLVNIYMINIDGNYTDGGLRIHINNGEKIYYHGTDSTSAKSIIDCGINLKKTKGKHDFSFKYGFYVTSNYKKAVEWSKRKSGNFSERAAAVITFRISRSLREEEPNLSLKGSSAKDMNLWRDVVSHFRTGELNVHWTIWLKDFKFIKGPVSKNAFLRKGQIPIPYKFNQICIRNEDYAKRFGCLQNICAVQFFSVNEDDE